MQQFLSSSQNAVPIKIIIAFVSWQCSTINYLSPKFNVNVHNIYNQIDKDNVAYFMITPNNGQSFNIKKSVLKALITDKFFKRAHLSIIINKKGSALNSLDIKIISKEHTYLISIIKGSAALCLTQSHNNYTYSVQVVLCLKRSVQILVELMQYTAHQCENVLQT